jgi:predicted nucleic acid-binding protein
MDYLVDSNVIIDVVTEDPRFFEWASAALENAADAGLLCVNPIIFAEISIDFDRVEDARECINGLDFQYADLPWDAAFLSGKAFASYRRQGGVRRSPLPDFYIGAHAVVTGMTLLTRDPARYWSYFPKLILVAP